MIFTSLSDNCHSSHLDTTHHAWFTNNSSTTDLTVASFHKQIGAKDMMMHKHGLGRKLAQERVSEEKESSWIEQAVGGGNKSMAGVGRLHLGTDWWYKIRETGSPRVLHMHRSSLGFIVLHDCGEPHISDPWSCIQYSRTMQHWSTYGVATSIVLRRSLIHYKVGVSVSIHISACIRRLILLKSMSCVHLRSIGSCNGRSKMMLMNEL